MINKTLKEYYRPNSTIVNTLSRKLFLITDKLWYLLKKVDVS